MIATLPTTASKASATDLAVDVRALSHTYNDRRAIDGLTLSVRLGEIFGLLGPNGSGKTTLFRVLSTLIPPQDGAVTMLGHDLRVERNAVRRDIGVVFQSPALDKQLTAYENLACQGALYGLSGPSLKARIMELLAAVGLADRAAERVERYSGGMRRRVEIAKGLLHAPKLLLLDEPSTGLDPGARIDLWRLLNGIRDNDGVTVLMTTHLLEEAELCDRLAILAKGKLLACDTPAVLKSRIRGDVITLTTDEPTALTDRLRERLNLDATPTDPRTLRLQADRGHELVPKIVEAAPGLVLAVSVGQPSLADVFLSLTGHQYRAEISE